MWKSATVVAAVAFVAACGDDGGALGAENGDAEVPKTRGVEGDIDGLVPARDGGGAGVDNGVDSGSEIHGPHDAGAAEHYGATPDAAMVGDASLPVPDASVDASGGPSRVCDDAGACGCDFSGYWAMRQDVTLTMPEQKIGGTVFTQESISKITMWKLHRYEYDGKTIKVHKKGCGSDTYPKAVSPAYGENYSSGVPRWVFDDLGLQDGQDIPLLAKDALPGKGFATPKEAILVGIALADPLNDPWPASTADVPTSAWMDVDGDGAPGISLWPAEPNCPATNRPAKEDTVCYVPVELDQASQAVVRRASCISVARRTVSHLQGSINSCDRFRGSVVVDRSDGRVHSCIQVPESRWNTPQSCAAADWSDDDENVPCTQEHVDFLDQQNQARTESASFDLVRLGDLGQHVECSDVRNALPAIAR